MFGSVLSQLVSATQQSVSASLRVDDTSSAQLVQTLDPSAAIAALCHPCEPYPPRPVQDITAPVITEGHDDSGTGQNIAAAVPSRLTNGQRDQADLEMVENDRMNRM